MRRREFFTLAGSAVAAWPLTAMAQQPAMPVIGFFTAVPPDSALVAAFRRGLTEAGYTEGKNVRIEFRDANFTPKLLLPAARDLVRLNVDVIVAPGGPVSNEQHSHCCPRFGERSPCQGMDQDSCSPGRQHDRLLSGYTGYERKTLRASPGSLAAPFPPSDPRRRPRPQLGAIFRKSPSWRSLNDSPSFACSHAFPNLAA